MDVKIVKNARGETASYCERNGSAWSSEHTDAASVGMNLMQNVDHVFLPCAMTDADNRMFLVARSALSSTAPSVSPNDESERAMFRATWDAVCGLKSEFATLRDGFAFSNELGVWADRFFVGEKMGYVFVIQFKSSFVAQPCSDLPFACISKNGYANQDIREGLVLSVLAASGEIAHRSVGVGMTLAWNGSKIVREMRQFARCDDAAMMIALRSRTSWYKEWQKNLSF